VRLTNLARLLRRRHTDAEYLLWWHLQKRQIEGVKFRRQQPIGEFIVDFVSFQRRLIIELDGGQHAVENESDEKRDDWLRTQGFKVLRFWNNEVLQNLDGVLEIIRSNCLSPSPNPSHQGRENIRPEGK
jgi:very-short-patch-repair endonuclease